MRWASIRQCDIANGPGVRTSLFVSGCRHACPGCFNREAQDFEYGSAFTRREQDRLISACRPDFVRGITLLGGEPMEPVNQAGLLPFLRAFRAELPDKTVWCYTGCLWEELTGEIPSDYRTEDTDALLGLIDVLVDGPFVEKLHSVSLRFRGSSNQRLIDVPATLREGRIVPWRDDPLFSSHGM